MFEADQIEELRKLFSGMQQCTEAAHTYFLIQNYTLPSGCSPITVDLLFCPMPRDGYNSRLFFSEKVITRNPLNWNANCVRILERNWFAFSLVFKHDNLRLAQMLASHLRGLANAAS